MYYLNLYYLSKQPVSILLHTTMEMQIIDSQVHVLFTIKTQTIYNIKHSCFLSSSSFVGTLLIMYVFLCSLT